MANIAALAAYLKYQAELLARLQGLLGYLQLELTETERPTVPGRGRTLLNSVENVTFWWNFL